MPILPRIIKYMNGNEIQEYTNVNINIYIKFKNKYYN